MEADGHSGVVDGHGDDGAGDLLRNDVLIRREITQHHGSHLLRGLRGPGQLPLGRTEGHRRDRAAARKFHGRTASVLKRVQEDLALRGPDCNVLVVGRE